MNGNKIKAIQLGMPYGTASNRLKKNLMFFFAKKCGYDVCYRCNEKILSVEELSVEHKIPWLHSENPVELFFDIDNIAFSHLGCNIGDSRINLEECKNAGFNSHPEKIPPEGKAWCGCCKTFKDKENFTYNKKTRNKTEWICKSCRKEYRSKCSSINANMSEI